jgi:hypothetical protein
MPIINYSKMTPAQAHFAGRLDKLLEHQQNQGLRRYDWKLSARAGEHLDLDLAVTAFEYMPVRDILAPTIYTATYIDDEEVWRVWPARETVEQAGYDFETGQVSRPGIELPVADTGHPVMEVPEDWSDTAVHVVLELSDMHPESTLSQSQTGQVLEVLAVDHPDTERLALWLHDVEGHLITLRGLIENAEDWAETEDRRHEMTYHSREEYAREWVEENQRVEDWLMACLDFESVADALLDGMTYSEGRNGEVYLYEV